MHNQNSSKLWLNQTYSIKHLFTDATSLPVICLFILPPLFWLIAAITQLCRKEAQTTDKSLEDVLGNLNLSSTITPQMINLGLSQERKLLSVFDERDIKQASCFHAEHDSAFSTCLCICDLYGVFTVVDEVWHQQAVFRLLQLIELPLLESLLEGKETSRRALHGMDSDPDLLYTSSYLDREVLKAFSEAQ